MSERIAKTVARAGICSRREAERLIDQGRVRVNGTTLTSPALNVTAEDRIEIDGKPLPVPETARLFRFHKPVGVLTAERDPQERRTIYDVLPSLPGHPRVMPVGRLDLNTEGLLLLTNDGELKRSLEHPANKWARQYRVRVRGKVDPKKLEDLKDGIVVENIHYGSIKAQIEKTGTTNTWLQIGMQEGKNREIRKVMGALGLQVNRLIRTAYGPFLLDGLLPGQAEEIAPEQIRKLDQRSEGLSS